MEQPRNMVGTNLHLASNFVPPCCQLKPKGRPLQGGTCSTNVPHLFHPVLRLKTGLFHLFRVKQPPTHFLKSKVSGCNKCQETSISLRFEMSHFLALQKSCSFCRACKSFPRLLRSKSLAEYLMYTTPKRVGISCFFVSVGFVFTDVCKGHFGTVIDHGRFMYGQNN